MDAASVLGEQANTDGIAELTGRDYTRAVAENMPRDYVRMYHPDNTSSIVQLPPLGKNGKGSGDRQRKIMHYILNKKIRGKQWWFAAPPPGWEPKVARYSCFLVGCDRNREPNLHTLFDLFQHFNHKHPDETKMYEGVLKAIQQKLSQEIPPELAEQLGLDSSTKMLNDDQFSQVMTGEHLVPAEELAEMLAPDAAEELAVVGMSEALADAKGAFDCADCDWTPKPAATRPDIALRGHRTHKHTEVAV